MTNEDNIFTCICGNPKIRVRGLGMYCRDCDDDIFTPSPKEVPTIEDKVTRFEVIDHRASFEEGGGRVLAVSGDDLKVELSYQDDGRTLKVFFSKRK